VLVPLSPGWAVAVSILAWTAIGVLTGLVGSRLPDGAIDHDSWLTRIRPFEDGGHIYQRRLRLNRWKDRLPEAGALFPGGRSKRHLPGRDDESLVVFAMETRRAELVHWANLFAGPLFVIWCPPAIAAVMVCFGVAAHAPFICVQRSNRAQIDRILDARRRRGPHPSE